MTMHRKTSLLLIVPVLCLTAASAAMAEKAARMYKWVDADGNVQYSNRLPPEATQAERKVINDQGRVLKVYSAPQSEEEKAEARRLAELEAKRKERERKRAIHDRSLLATYANIDDMRNAQDGKITMVESLVQLTHSRITSMEERLVTLTEEAARYERSGKSLPLTLQQQIQNLRDQIAHNSQFASDKEAEIVEIKAQFERDIRRYEQLTGDEPLRASQGTALEIAMSNPDLQLDRDDRTLLIAYSSEEDLQFARREELEAIEQEIRTTFEEVENLQKQLTNLSNTAADYQTSGKAVPDSLAGRVRVIRDRIATAEQVLQAKRQRKHDVEQQYTADIERFRVLTASSH